MVAVGLSGGNRLVYAVRIEDCESTSHDTLGISPGRLDDLSLLPFPYPGPTPPRPVPCCLSCNEMPTGAAQGEVQAYRARDDAVHERMGPLVPVASGVRVGTVA